MSDEIKLDREKLEWLKRIIPQLPKQEAPPVEPAPEPDDRYPEGLKADWLFTVGMKEQITAYAKPGAVWLRLGNKHTSGSITLSTPPVRDGFPTDRGPIIAIEGPMLTPIVEISGEGIELPDETAAGGRRLFPWSNVVACLTHLTQQLGLTPGPALYERDGLFLPVPDDKPGD